MGHTEAGPIGTERKQCRKRVLGSGTGPRSQLTEGSPRRVQKVSDMLGITGVLNSVVTKLSMTMPGSVFAKER